ncbi:MAG: DUF190 domain-containing protein [Caldimicrobium sp.]
MEFYNQPGIILRIYVREEDKYERVPLYKKIIDIAKENGLAGATVFRAIMGYGPSKEIRKISFADFSANLPILIEFIDTEVKIKAFLEKINGMIKHGLITIQPIYIVKNLP